MGKAKNPTHRRLLARLRDNINRLEAGLRVTDGGKQQRVEYGGSANPGWIDMTAEDKRGATVVIELKTGKAGRRAIGQVLGYMGALMPRKKPVRGILVADKLSPQGIAAASPVPTLQLRKLSSLRLNDTG